MNLEIFHPAVARWFTKTFPSATPPQQEAWPAIKQQRNTLIAAPTGSGKTLSAFLAAIDDLVRIVDEEGHLDELVAADRIDEVRRIVAARVASRGGVAEIDLQTLEGRE